MIGPLGAALCAAPASQSASERGHQETNRILAPQRTNLSDEKVERIQKVADYAFVVNEMKMLHRPMKKANVINRIREQHEAWKARQVEAAKEDDGASDSEARTPSPPHPPAPLGDTAKAVSYCWARALARRPTVRFPGPAALPCLCRTRSSTTSATTRWTPT